MSVTKIPTALPDEYSHYADTGCKYSTSCLKCRRIFCRYDPDAKELRKKCIRQLDSQGMKPEHIALVFDIKPRTVRAILGETP